MRGDCDLTREKCGDTMPITVTLEEAQAKLKELVQQLGPGDEIIITQQDRAIARLRGEVYQPINRPAPGLGRGSITFMSDNFDGPLEEMEEYME
jgi:antitoxin (DNA-binding transcriptional repressor) of toxin-antitoxin stability system